MNTQVEYQIEGDQVLGLEKQVELLIAMRTLFEESFASLREDLERHLKKYEKRIPQRSTMTTSRETVERDIGYLLALEREELRLGKQFYASWNGNGYAIKLRNSKNP